MSLGFLTESTLLPSKPKSIKIDSKSIVDLKAIVYEKEHERDVKNALTQNRKRRRGSRSTLSSASRISIPSNHGIQERIEKDQMADSTSLNSDRQKKMKSRACLEQKAALYDQLARANNSASGHVENEDEACLVDFEQKRRLQQGALPLPLGQDETMIEIQDEFGRTRHISRDQEAHHLKPSHHRTSSSPSLPGKSTNYVVSQWERTLKHSEKEFLKHHFQNQSLDEKALTPMEQKKRRKEARLNRIRSKHQPQSVVTTAEREDAAQVFLDDLAREYS